MKPQQNCFFLVFFFFFCFFLFVSLYRHEQRPSYGSFSLILSTITWLWLWCTRANIGRLHAIYQQQQVQDTFIYLKNLKTTMVHRVFGLGAWSHQRSAIAEAAAATKTGRWREREREKSTHENIGQPLWCLLFCWMNEQWQGGWWHSQKKHQ